MCKNDLEQQRKKHVNVKYLDVWCFATFRHPDAEIWTQVFEICDQLPYRLGQGGPLYITELIFEQ